VLLNYRLLLELNVDQNKGKKLQRVDNVNYTMKCTDIIYCNHSKESLKRDFTAGQWRLLIESTQIR
jgi:hypothetical protein